MPLPEQGVSPAMPEAEEGMWRWLEEYALVPDDAVRQHLVRTRPHYTVACYYPRLDVKRLTYLAQYTAWAFIVDDMFDDSISTGDERAVRVFADDLIGAALQERDPSTACGRALRDLLGRMSAGRTPHWRHLLGDSQERWLATYPKEVRHSVQARPMHFNDYIPHRRWGTDELFYILMEEYARGIELTAEIRGLPALASARERALEWIGLYNDIVSAEKEESVGYLHNGVIIVREHRKCLMQEAVDAIDAVLTGLMGQFLAACDAVPAQVRAVVGDDPGAAAAAALAVEGYRDLVRGNYDYHRDTARYVDALDYIPRAQTEGLLPNWCHPTLLR